jgi:hypothetical protein
MKQDKKSIPLEIDYYHTSTEQAIKKDWRLAAPVLLKQLTRI